MDKPGIQTTEFWVTSIVNIVMAVMAILAVRGLASKEEADLYVVLARALVAAIAPIVIAFVSGRYISGRAEVKANRSK